MTYEEADELLGRAFIAAQAGGLGWRPAGARVVRDTWAIPPGSDIEGDPFVEVEILAVAPKSGWTFRVGYHVSAALIRGDHACIEADMRSMADRFVRDHDQ